MIFLICKYASESHIRFINIQHIISIRPIKNGDNYDIGVNVSGYEKIMYLCEQNPYKNTLYNTFNNNGTLKTFDTEDKANTFIVNFLTKLREPNYQPYRN
jgi:hypothetical protein